MGRLTPTHRAITWDEFMAEALGGLNLHPWELWEYTLQEYIWKRRGTNDVRRKELREDWILLRHHAFFTLSPYLKKGATMENIIPDIFEPVTTKSGKKEHINKVMKRYQDAGLI